MQQSLAGVILMTAIIVVGFIVTLIFSKTKPARYASIAAFASMAIILVIFFMHVISASTFRMTSFYAFVIVAVPVVIYLVVSAVMIHREKAEKAALRIKRAAPKQENRQSEASSPMSTAKPQGVSTKETPFASPSYKKVPSAVYPEITTIPLQPEKPVKLEEFVVSEEPFISDEPVKPEELTAPKKPITENELVAVQEEEFQATSAPIYVEPEPILEAEPEIAVEPEPIIEPELEHIIEVSTDPEPEPEPIVESISEPEPEPEPEPLPEPEPIVESISEPELVAQPAAVEKSVGESFFDKAQKFKEKGNYIVAARLFEEAHDKAEDEQLAHKAAMAAMASYVKGGQLGEARNVALMLSEDTGSLSTVDAMKIDAVLRS